MSQGWDALSGCVGAGLSIADNLLTIQRFEFYGKEYFSCLVLGLIVYHSIALVSFLTYITNNFEWCWLVVKSHQRLLCHDTVWLRNGSHYSPYLDWDEVILPRSASKIPCSRRKQGSIIYREPYFVSWVAIVIGFQRSQRFLWCIRCLSVGTLSRFYISGLHQC